MPHEVSFGDLFVPRILISFVIAMVLSQYTSKVLNKYRLSKYFVYAPLVYMCFLTFYTIWVDVVLGLL